MCVGGPFGNISVYCHDSLSTWTEIREFSVRFTTFQGILLFVWHRYNLDTAGNSFPFHEPCKFHTFERQIPPKLQCISIKFDPQKIGSHFMTPVNSIPPLKFCQFHQWLINFTFHVSPWDCLQRCISISLLCTLKGRGRKGRCHLSHGKKNCYFPWNTGCLIGIFILVYCNPYITW